MKNEDRIVELLSESLKRQDQMVEQMFGMNKQMSGMNQRLENVENKLGEHTDILKSLVKSFNGLADLVKHSLQELKRLDAMEERLRRLEKHTGLD